MQLPESFWAETNSCFRHLRYYGGYKGLVVCYKGKGCNGKRLANYRKLPNAHLVTIDFRNDYDLYTSRNLRLLRQWGIIKSASWKEYKEVIYRLLLNPSRHVMNSVENVMSQVPSKQFSVSAHIRCAGNLAEFKEGVRMVTEQKFASISRMIVSAVKQNRVVANQSVFIATDSSYALTKLTSLVHPIKVYSNKQVMRGHSTIADRNVVHSSLTDLFLLTKSKVFIGVDRSGFSNVAAMLSNFNCVRWIRAHWR